MKKPENALADCGGHEASLAEDPKSEAPTAQLIFLLKVAAVPAAGFAILLGVGASNQINAGVPPPGPIVLVPIVIAIAASFIWVVTAWILGIPLLLLHWRTIFRGPPRALTTSEQIKNQEALPASAEQVRPAVERKEEQG